ncbi:hypothetical protein RintRC_3474 [Richelia intracellularis]|nr:hypothetical protein RintRC_3474 [Richelia intracellularis]
MPLFFYSSTLDLSFIGKFFLINHLNSNNAVINPNNIASPPDNWGNCAPKPLL